MRILYNAAEQRGAAAPPGPPPATAPHMDPSDENSKPGRKPVPRAMHWLCQCSPTQAARFKTQNRGARNVNFLGQQRPFARSRAILQFAARATGPQNAGRKTRKIAGRNAPLARPRRAAPAVPANRASQNHPPSGEKTQNPSRNSPPPLEKLPQNTQNRVSLATRRNSQTARSVRPRRWAESISGEPDTLPNRSGRAP